MNLPRANKCVLIIPDAGPLISLWSINALDLLVKTKLPIIIVDMVKYEVINTPESYPQGRDLLEFIRENTLQIETMIGSNFFELQKFNSRARKVKDMGEYAIADFIKNNLPNINNTNPAVILYEDNFVPKLLADYTDRVHLVSTVSFLKNLEKIGLVPNANELIEKIIETGRNINLKELDQETTTGSSWLPEM